MGKYLYCIIGCPQERTFDVAAIGDDQGRAECSGGSGMNNAVHTVCYDGLAAVVSDSPAARYETTRKHMMAHEMVLERVMQEFTLLPVRFGTVTESASPVEDVRRLLRDRFQEFGAMLEDMEGRVELGLKALWRDEKAVFAEILAENADMRRLRDSLARKPPQAVRFDGIALGRMVKEALERKRGQEAAQILSPLRPLAEGMRENDTLVDRMVVNAAFLVHRGLVPDFDRAISELDRARGGRMGFKYVGPTPPYNFVNIVVNWPELEPAGAG